MTKLRIAGTAITNPAPCIRCGTPERNHYGAFHRYEVQGPCFSCGQAPGYILVDEGAVCGGCAPQEPVV